VDDDTLYPPRLLETLLEWNRRLPDAALAFSGWPVVEKTLRYPHWSENYLVYGNEVGHHHHHHHHQHHHHLSSSLEKEEERSAV